MPEFEVTPNAIITPAELRDYLKRATSAGEAQRAAAANWTTAIFESRTRRKLRERVFVTPFTIACTTTTDDTTIAGTTFTTKLRPKMDVFGANLRFGSRVASITSAVAAELTQKAKATGAQTLTFGEGALEVDGDGCGELLLPEAPVEEVYAAYSRDSDGVLNELDLTAIVIDKEAGIIRMPNASMPRGSRNILVECRAGYRPRTNEEPGHEEWGELFGVALGIAEILFQRYSNALGASVETMAGNSKKTILPDVEFPKVLENAIRMFERGDLE